MIEDIKRGLNLMDLALAGLEAKAEAGALNYQGDFGPPLHLLWEIQGQSSGFSNAVRSMRAPAA